MSQFDDNPDNTVELIYTDRLLHMYYYRMQKKGFLRKWHSKLAYHNKMSATEISAVIRKWFQ